MKKILFAFLLLSSTIAFAGESDSVKVARMPMPKKQLTQEQVNKKNDVEKKFAKFAKDRFTFDLFGSNWIYNKSDAKFGQDFKTK